MMISILNTVEYNEYKFGTRDDAIIAPVRPFMTKLASALIILFTTLTYLAFNVTGFTNQISDLEQQANAGTITEAVKNAGIGEILGNVTTGQTNGLLIVMCVLPMVFMIITYVLNIKKYELDEDRFAEIVAELEMRKAN